MSDVLKRAEERKREARWNKLARWRAIQAAITWAESQRTCHRNTPAACIASQGRIRK